MDWTTPFSFCAELSLLLLLTAVVVGAAILRCRCVPLVDMSVVVAPTSAALLSVVVTVSSACNAVIAPTR